MMFGLSTKSVCALLRLVGRTCVVEAYTGVGSPFWLSLSSERTSAR